MGQVVAFSFFFTLFFGLLTTLLISSAFRINELPTKEDFKRLEDKLDRLDAGKSNK